MTNETYHADTMHISKSGLDLIDRSPLHYWHAYLRPDREPKKPTPAQIFGSMVHTAILEPDQFKQSYVVMPKIDRRTVKGKAEYEEFMLAHGDKIAVTQEEYSAAEAMWHAINNHDTAYSLLSSGVAEQSLFFTEPVTGAPCKIRPDWDNQELAWLVDIKTAEDASPDGFAKAAAKYNYHKQAAFYMDGYEAATGRKVNGMAFIAVEKEPPYNVAVYYISHPDIEPDEAYQLGRRHYLSGCGIYVNCLQTGVWPGYDISARKLQLPRWAFTELS